MSTSKKPSLQNIIKTAMILALFAGSYILLLRIQTNWDYEINPFPTSSSSYSGSKVRAPLEEPPDFSTKYIFGDTPLPVYGIDKKTSLHDGVESYVKLGRLSIVKEERGKRFAALLISAALKWAKENAEEIQKGVKEEVPKWKGLVCVHSQEKAIRVWARNGFVLDEGMGTWFEGGIKHVAMFKRLTLEQK